MISVVFVVAGLVLITVAVGRVSTLREPVATDIPPNAPTGSDSGIDVIIPARDEATALPALLADLARQTLAPARVVVVDDDSADDTGAIAASWGATVVTPPPRPDGWNPKVWALHVGVGSLTGCDDGEPAAGHGRRPARLVFLDADVRLAPDALGALVAVADTAGGLVSVAPYHCRPDADGRLEALGAVESLSAPFNITIDAGGGPGIVGRARGAVGSCLTITTADYEATGGHAATPNTIVDDLSLAATARAAGLAVTLLQSRPAPNADRSGPPAPLAARPLVTVRSYPTGFGSLARGWVKNLSAGMGMTPPISALVVAWWAASLVMPVAVAAQAEWTTAAGLWALVAAHTWWIARSVGRFQPIVVSLGAPALGVWFAAVSAASVVARLTRRTVTWKGRALRPDGVER